MGVRSGLINLLLGSLITTILLMVLPFWLGWPSAFILFSFLAEGTDKWEGFELTWLTIGSFLPLYYVVL